MREYLVLINYRDEVWRDCGEGPFASRESAERFAQDEVGLPWIVVRIETAETLQLISELQGRNREV